MNNSKPRKVKKHKFVFKLVVEIEGNLPGDGTIMDVSDRLSQAIKPHFPLGTLNVVSHMETSEIIYDNEN